MAWRAGTITTHTPAPKSKKRATGTKPLCGGRKRSSPSGTLENMPYGRVVRTKNMHAMHMGTAGMSTWMSGAPG